MQRVQKLGKLGLLALLCVAFWAPEGVAKSKKYQRSKSKKARSVAKKKAGKKAAKAAPAEGEKKVDLSDLENRYWTAKDTEFTVVQNRLYTKDKRFSLTALSGPLLSDTFTSSFSYGLAANYYFSEREGVELQGWLTSSVDSDVSSAFKSTYGLVADHNKPKGYIGANYVWVPVYAKLSLLEKKILYFDMYISPGLGLTMLESVTFAGPGTAAPASTSFAAPTFALDIGQQVFLSEHWALRIDARNRFLQEKVYNASTGEERRTKFTYHGSLMIGVTYYFPRFIK